MYFWSPNQMKKWGAYTPPFDPRPSLLPYKPTKSQNNLACLGSVIRKRKHSKTDDAKIVFYRLRSAVPLRTHHSNVAQ